MVYVARHWQQFFGIPDLVPELITGWAKAPQAWEAQTSEMGGALVKSTNTDPRFTNMNHGIIDERPLILNWVWIFPDWGESN